MAKQHDSAAWLMSNEEMIEIATMLSCSIETVEWVHSKLTKQYRDKTGIIRLLRFSKALTDSDEYLRNFQIKFGSLDLLAEALLHNYKEIKPS